MQRDEIALGQKLAEQLSVRIGDTISILTARGSQTPFGIAPRIKSYPVVAIFQIGVSEFDGIFVYMPFTEAQAFFNKDDEATVIEAFVEDPDRMDEIRDRLDQSVQRPVMMTSAPARSIALALWLKLKTIWPP